MREDIRYAFRSLRRNTGFVVVAILALGFAVGLNTTVFAILDSFLHPYMPYRDPHRLARIAIAASRHGDGVFSQNDRYLLVRSRVRFAEDMAIYTLENQIADADGQSEAVSVAAVSRNFFVMLGTSAKVGRTLEAGPDEQSVVISDRRGRRMLGQRPLESKPLVSIAGRPYAVVGIMPPEMGLPEAADLWRLLPTQSLEDGLPGDAPQIVVRLKPGVTRQEVFVELDLITKELQQARFAGRGAGFSAWVKLLDEDSFQLAASHWALVWSAAIVLLIACANLANLMLARGTSRRPELALQAAIGASRQRLIRQLTAEGLLLGIAGAVLGFMLAVWGVSLASGNIPTLQSFITLRPLHLSWRSLGFLMTLLMATTVAIGLLPAIRISSEALGHPLKESATTITGRTRRYSLLAATQVALALALLMSSAILTRSASKVVNEESDWNQPDVYFVFIPYRNQAGPSLDDIADRVCAVPGVTVCATRTFSSLFRPGKRIGGPVWGDWEGAAATPLSVGGTNVVSADYFRSVARRIVSGRHFNSTDPDVVIVNQAAARALWPTGDPVGHSLRIDNGPWIRVVGVVEDFRYGHDSRAADPEIFLKPVASTAQGGTIVFRIDHAVSGVLANVARTAQQAALLRTALPIRDGGEEARLNGSTKRFFAGLFGVLAACGVGLACLGLYGVLSYTVSRRTREFGVRMALGATPGDMVRLVIHDGTVMLLAGTAAGAFVAMLVAQLVSSLLYKVTFTDPLSLVASELLLCACAFAACLVPAWRAMKSDPAEILRAT